MGDADPTNTQAIKPPKHWPASRRTLNHELRLVDQRTESRRAVIRRFVCCTDKEFNEGGYGEIRLQEYNDTSRKSILTIRTENQTVLQVVYKCPLKSAKKG